MSIKNEPSEFMRLAIYPMTCILLAVEWVHRLPNLPQLTWIPEKEFEFNRI
ncbi:hypothetical protein T10_13664 [Trichinella papuae]|uniref:Uncharacterized protein n=1 Tax=Trichinella papuae TaxID=268474 RepID=A0A0V1N8Z8_9BILA|nr:hypothetical protein T10_13664 [Trichinella papuae]